MISFQLSDLEQVCAALKHLHGQYTSTPIVVHIAQSNATFIHFDASEVTFSAHTIPIENPAYTGDVWVEMTLSSLSYAASGLHSKIRAEEKQKLRAVNGRKTTKALPLPEVAIRVEFEEPADTRKRINMTFSATAYTLTPTLATCQPTQRKAAIEAYVSQLLAATPEHTLVFDLVTLQELIQQVGFVATKKARFSELHSSQQMLLQAEAGKLLCLAVNPQISALRACKLPKECPPDFQAGLPSWTFEFLSKLEATTLLQVVLLKNRLVFKSQRFVVAASRLDQRFPLDPWKPLKGEVLRIVVDYTMLQQQIAGAAHWQQYARKPQMIAEILESSLRLAEKEEQLETALRLPVFERSGALKGPIQIELNPFQLEQILRQFSAGSIVLELDEQISTVLGVRQRLGGNGCKFQLHDVRLLSPQVQGEPREIPVEAEIQEEIQIEEDPRPQSALEQLAQIVRQRQLAGTN